MLAGSIRPKSLVLGIVVAVLAWPASAQNVPLAQLISIDVPSAEIEGDFRLDGQATSPLPSEVGLVWLHTLHGEIIPLGFTFNQSYGPISILPGTYDADYHFANTTTGDLPINVGTPLATDLELTGSTIVDFDLETVELTLDVLLESAPFPVGPGGLAELHLRHRESGREFPVGPSSQLPLVVRVLPGRYDVIYAHQWGSAIPQNTHAVIAEDQPIQRDGSLTIDLDAFVHFVEPRVNGTPFPASLAERGAIRLVDPESGDAVLYGTTDQGTTSRLILPGTYDAVYSHVAGGGIAPANGEAIVAEDVVLAPPANPAQLSITTVDMTAYTVTPEVTIDGVAPPASLAERGRIVFSGPLGDAIDFGTTNAPLSSRRLIVGRYDVYYQRLNGWTVVPGNPNAKIASALRVVADVTPTIDIPTAQLSFDLRVDGEPFLPSPLERGRFTLVGEAEGDEIDLGPTHEAPPSPRVVAGTYDLVYDWEAGSVAVPQNVGHHALVDAELLTDQTVAVDLTTLDVVPTFSLDGAPFPSDPAHRGEIRLRDGHGGELSLGTTEVAVPNSVIAVQGAYAVDYLWKAGTDVPRNPRGRVGFANVPEPGFGLGLLVGVAALAARPLRSAGRARPLHRSGAA